MDNLLFNGLPAPLADVKEMDDCIIQEMNFKVSNEDIVNQWDTKIRRKITSKLSVCKNEKVSEDILKDYIRSLKEQAKNFKEKKVLREKISCHLKVFHLLYSTRENVGLYVVNYLDYIENVLIVLCNLELEVIRQLKKNHVGKEYNKTVKKVARRIIDSLSINLLNEEKRIFHVLLKLDYKHEQSWKDVMHIVYNHYLINLPIRDRSDLSFCRYYLLFQKWKNITDKNKHQVMDQIMYLKFDKTPESISSNPVLKSILLPSTESLVDLVDVLTNGQQVAVNAYFKYIEGSYEDDEIRVPPAIELDSDEDEESTQQLLFEPSESERQNGLIKLEKHNKSPIQGNARYVEISSNEGQVVCVIDDDSDVEEVCVQDSRSSRRRKISQKSVSSRPVVSFLDSICLPDETSSSPTDASSSAASEKESSLPPPAETLVLPLVTAYVDSARRQSTRTDADTRATSAMEIESPSARDDLQTEVASLTNVLNTVSCKDVDNLADDSRTTTKNASGDSSHSKNNNSTSVCVQSVVSFQNNIISKETQSVSESDKCTCCCKHSTNHTSTSSNDTNSATVTPNISVTKPNLKTVEIQTDNMDSFSYLCGMITPPSDRTAEENSPTSLENICPEAEIHNNNSLHSGNTNVYAYVGRDSYIESNSHNHYESDVETHSSNYSGVCESSTQVHDLDQPIETPIQNENGSKEDAAQRPSENIQVQNSNLKESFEILTPAQIEETPINEIELGEESTYEIESNEVESEKQVGEDRLDESGSESLINENEIIQTHTEEQTNEHRFEGEAEEQANQSEFDETDADNDFNEICLEDSEEVVGELELTDTHIDHTELVSEIELHEEILSEMLPVEENEISNKTVQNQESSVLEHCETASETNAEDHGDQSSTSNEEHQVNNSMEETCALSEPESIVNSISTDNSNYAKLTNVPIIIAQTQNTDLQESAIDIPFDLINTVILGDRYVPDKEIVLVPTLEKGDGESTKFTVYKIAAEVAGETFLEDTENSLVYNGEKSVSTELSKASGKESSILKDVSVTESETQLSCKIQASVTMAQLVNKPSPKVPKNGEHLKVARKKKVEENTEKIIFTSNERVKSAPLSLFAKFEQSQSDLVENAFSGPIEPINGKTNINCDNSNSNDSFCLFDSDRSVITKDFRDNNTPEEEGSPISPPYENIHAQEYQNHILKVNLENLCIKRKNNSQKMSVLSSVLRREEEKRVRPSTPTTNIHHKEEKKCTSDSTEQKQQQKPICGILIKPVERQEEKLNIEPSNNFAVPVRPSVMANKSATKRKRNDNRSTKKLKVNFGHTEIRFIPREEDKLVNESISQESLDEYNIANDDLKLLYLHPEVVIKLDSTEDLKRRLHKLYVNSILNNLLFEKKVKSDNTCIMTRVDYKKSVEDSLSKNRPVDSTFSLGYSNSTGLSVPSAITKRVEAPRIPAASPPSGYIPALNTSKSGLKRTLDDSQDKEDVGTHSSDSRGRTRRKRTPTVKAMKAPPVKVSPQPSTSTKPPPKRARGRPKKSETTKNSKNSNVGVLYSDGPFRLG